MELERRRVATTATLNSFRGVDFDWSTTTCAHLLHTHLTNMGYTPPDVPNFRTAKGAARALKASGWDDVSQMLDSLLVRRRAPAFMILGDVALVKGVDLDAIYICAGPLKLFGWREDENGLVLIDVSLDQLMGAWQV